MTFTEAAVEVLRIAGKPLHYKKITEIAIERNLLSHVGKTPETTMSSRLATMVKKDRGDAPILKVKPGVFALREFPKVVVEEDDDTTSDSDAPEAFDLEESAEDEPGFAVDDAEDEDEEDEPELPAHELPGAHVFPREDDDDELILANLDEDSREGRKSSRKRRPRRRRDRDVESGPSAEARPERRPVPHNRPQREPQAPATRVAEAGEPVGRDLSDAIETALRNGSRQPRTFVQVAEALIDSGRLAGTPGLLGPTLAAAVRGDNAKRRASGGRPRFRAA
ncbi:MAG: winged helix-turn-helix domain-containing protein, partial [Myxococcales bacterium]|nr:winged helix-turn-helix domain-containing protein [Myxococcales bacterium]